MNTKVLKEEKKIKCQEIQEDLEPYKIKIDRPKNVVTYGKEIFFFFSWVPIIFCHVGAC